MRKLSAIVGLVLMVAVGATATPLLLKGQVPAQPAPAAEDMPHRTAKAFAPFIRAIVMRRGNTASQIFKVRRSVETSLEQPETSRILTRFVKPDELELNLVGGRMLGNNIGVLLFTIATQDGPVAFKIYYYGFDQDVNVARVDVMDDWDEIEQAAAGVEALQAPINVPLNGQVGGDQ